MLVDRTEISEALRSRGQGARADWVDRTLPPLVDTDRNGGLLKTLEINPDTLAPVDPAPESG